MANNQRTNIQPARKRSSSPALGGPMPTPIEENKSLVRRFIHAIERGDFAVFDEIVSPDYKRPSSRTEPGPREPQAVLRWGALSFPG